MRSCPSFPSCIGSARISIGSEINYIILFKGNLKLVGNYYFVTFKKTDILNITDIAIKLYENMRTTNNR